MNKTAGWVSAIIILLIILLLILNNTESELGKGFISSAVLMLLQTIALATGLSEFFIWLVISRNFSISFVYILFIAINFSICIYAIAQYFFFSTEKFWLHRCLLNGMVALTMLIPYSVSKKNK